MAELISLLNTLRSGTPIFRTLRRVIIDTDTISLGNNAVVARCSVGGRSRAMRLKCYYRRHPNLAEIYNSGYLPREVGIYSLGGKVSYVDAVLTPWVEGTPLDVVMQQADADYATLGARFDAMAHALMSKPYAHGDLKPSNIILRSSGAMQIIDWDAMWRADMRMPSNEWGTPAFSHPKRGRNDHNLHIDDYSIVLISTTLAALAADSRALRPYLREDGSLFDTELLVRGEEPLLDYALKLFEQRGDVIHSHEAELLRSPHYALPSIHEWQSTCGVTPERLIVEGCVRCGAEALPRSGDSGITADDESLAALFTSGAKISTIAHQLNRSESTIRRRIKSLCLT